jgi:hypothetical protein
VAEPAGDDLSLLLAIDRVWRTPPQESSVAVGENCEHHSDQDDSGREIDQPLAVALAERRGARSI